MFLIVLRYKEEPLPVVMLSDWFKKVFPFLCDEIMSIKEEWWVN